MTDKVLFITIISQWWGMSTCYYIKVNSYPLNVFIMPLNFTILVLFCLFLSLIPLFVNTNKEKSYNTTVISRIIIGLLLLVSLNILLDVMAYSTNQARIANCPSELIVLDSTFGNSCKSEIKNPFERILADNFGGPFAGIIAIGLGLPTVFILSIVGFVFEVKSTRKKMQPVSKALWSTSFITLASLLALCVLTFTFSSFIF